MEYQLNYRETGSFLKSGQLSDAIRKAAEDVADEARSIVAAEARDTGALLESIHVEPSPGRDRTGWAVVADDEAAAPNEFGNDRMPNDEVEHFLVRALGGADISGVEPAGGPEMPRAASGSSGLTSMAGAGRYIDPQGVLRYAASGRRVPAGKQ